MMGRRARVGLAVLAVLAMLAIPVVILFVAPMTYSALLERAVRSSTGLETRFTALEIDLFPPRFAMEGLRLLSLEPDFSEPLLEVDRFSVTLDADDYLANAAGWWRAQASGVRVRLARTADGRGNWDRPTAPDQQQNGNGAMSLFRFDSIEIDNLDLFRIAPGQHDRLHIAKLSLERDTNERMCIALDGSFQDQPLKASGSLAMPGSKVARDMRLRASVFGGELHMEGTVGHNGITPGEVRITASADDLSILSRLLDQDLNAWAPFELSGTLQAPRPDRWKFDASGEFGEHVFDVRSSASVADTRWELDALEVQIDDSKITGTLSFDGAEKLLQASLASPRLDIDGLLGLGPQGAGADNDREMNLDPLRHWTLNTNVEIEELLWQEFQATGVTLETDTKAAALQISASIDQAVSGNADGWRIVEPLRVDATLTPDAQARSAGTLTANFSSSGVDGEFDMSLSASNPQSLQAALQARIEGFSALQGIDTDRWNTFLPLTASMQIRGTPQQIQLDPVTLGFSGDVMEGSMTLDRGRSPLRISGALQGSSLDLKRFRTTPEPRSDGTADDPDNGSPGGVIGDHAIDWSWLAAAELDLSLQLDKLTFNQSVFYKLRTQVVLTDGKLDIDPLDAELTNGGVRGHVRVHKNDYGATLDTRLIVTELVPADLSRKGKGLVDGGETDLFVELHTRGATPQQLASALNGEIALEVQRATVRNDYLDIIGSDLVTQTVNLINPFTSQDDHTELECAAVRFVAEDGVLNSPDQIVIETSKMKIRGGGEVNLNDETMRIDFVPSARTGVGIGVGDVARFVRLGGTLGDPRPVADPQGILKSGATIGAAIATGGASLLAQGLFNRARNLGTACGRIFEDTTDVPGEILNDDRAAGAGD